MNKDKLPIKYWDSCVWIALIGEEKTNEIYDGCLYAEEQVRKEKVRLVLSQIVRLEVFKTNLNGENRKRFDQLIRRSNVEILSVNNRIVDIASDLQKEANSALRGKTLRAMDAIHLATAIYAEADELYVRDGDLLTLNGKIVSRKTPAILPPPPDLQQKLKL